MTSVEETTDYDIFKLHPSNRRLSNSNLTKLMKSIEENNLLRSCPIIVDKQYRVIDGQHRLAAAQKLGLPITFQICDGISSHDMVLLNNNQKQWSIGDYLNFYVSEGYLEYIKLADFCKAQNLQLNIALHLLNGCRSLDFFKMFKTGLYTYPDVAEYDEACEKNRLIKETIDYIKKKTSGPKGYLDRVTFYGALVDFFNIKSFEYDVFMKKLSFRLDLLRPCTKQGDYLNIFKNMYNWKNKEPIDFEE